MREDTEERGQDTETAVETDIVTTVPGQRGDTVEPGVREEDITIVMEEEDIMIAMVITMIEAAAET